MSEATTAGGESHDPLKMVADAMEAAVQTAREGAAGAQATVAEAVPAASKVVSNLVYRACYGVSYGVVFPSVLLARSIPKDNPVVHGFVDGARAAIDMVNEMKGSALAPPAPGPSILGPDGAPVVSGGEG